MNDGKSSFVRLYNIDLGTSNGTTANIQKDMEETDFDDFLGMVDQMVAIRQGWGMGVNPCKPTVEHVIWTYDF